MQTVYEISWINIAAALLPGLGFVVASTFMWISWHRRERGFRRVRFFICWMICVAIGICWLAVVVRIGCQYKTALRAGQCRVVEGTVSVVEKSSKARPAESIQIGTEVFSYYDEGAGITSYLSYHWLIVNGGPLTNGAYARLHILDGDDLVDEHILKVEIKR